MEKINHPWVLNQVSGIYLKAMCLEVGECLGESAIIKSNVSLGSPKLDESFNLNQTQTVSLHCQVEIIDFLTIVEHRIEPSGWFLKTDLFSFYGFKVKFSLLRIYQAKIVECLEHPQYSNSPKRKARGFPEVIHVAKREALKVADSLKSCIRHLRAQNKSQTYIGMTYSGTQMMTCIYNTWITCVEGAFQGPS